MKTTNHSGKRDKQDLFKPAGSSRAETALFATLGLAAFVAIIVAAQSALVPAAPMHEPLAALRKSPIIKYVRSGQLVADARTVAALVRYLMQPESPWATNVSGLVITQQDLVARTNNATAAPRA